MSQKTVTVSVRRLVEFILRSGDIDTVSGAFGEMDAMQQGGLMHRKLQKEAGPSYRAEVSLKHTTEMDETLAITVEGRADGVITETEMAADESGELGLKEVVTIDEIKGTYRNLRYITEPVLVHLAQAKCYAFFYAEKEDLEEIQVQMTYVHLKTGKVQRFREKMTRNELEVWYTELIDRFAVWVRHQIAWIKKRNLSIGAGSFPFEYRESQKKLVSGVYQTILRHRRLFVEAPTGTGKTISAIYPAVQAMGNGLSETIFYLTARTIARTVAEDTFGLLQDRGLAMKVITLTAKEKICVLDKVQCSPEYCPRAKGHYDRINEALYDLVTQEDRMTRECVLAYADKHQVCPFEFQLDAALFADAVIGDYNYVFDPNVALKRFFSDRSGDYLFLIDEAHNLVDRAREMYSAVMSMTELTHARHAVEDKAVDRRLVTYMDRSILAMSALRESSDESCQLMGNIGSLIVYLTKLSEQLEETLKEGVTAPLREVLMEFYFDIRRFICAFDRSDDRYLIYALRSEDSFEIKIFCVDPSKDLGERLAKGCGAVFFSATLLPVQYYKEMLSDTAASDYDLYVDSPFAEENRLLVAATDVSSRYTRRGRKEYERMAAYIRDIIRGKHGNYMVFFPSYQLMKDVFEVFTEMELMKAGHGLQLVVQESEMSEDARQKFLDAFQADAADAVIGFCVMGGIFSEGIDLKEDRLIGVIIIGTGLPQVGEERELLSRYFNEKSGRGFEYAYLYPGMNKVLQAAGRVIRTEKDRGVIALLDERFNYSQYRKMFPREWHNCSKTSLNTIVQQVEDFWTDKA